MNLFTKLTLLTWFSLFTLTAYSQVVTKLKKDLFVAKTQGYQFERGKTYIVRIKSHDVTFKVLKISKSGKSIKGKILDGGLKIRDEFQVNSPENHSSDLTHVKKKKRKKRRKKKKKLAKKGSFVKNRFFFSLNPSYNLHGSMSDDPNEARKFLQDNICTGQNGNTLCQVIDASNQPNFTERFKVTNASPFVAISAGYYFSRFFSSDFQYSFLGTEDIDFRFVSTNTPVNSNDIYQVENTFSALELNLNAHLWISHKINLFLSAGGHRWSISKNERSKIYITPSEFTDNENKDSFSGFSFHFGGGLNFFIKERAFLGLKATLYPKIGDDTSGYQKHLSTFLKIGYLF